MAELYKHMDERGTPINTTPAINGKDLDLYRLYRIVTFLGGHSRYVLHTQPSQFIRSCQKVSFISFLQGDQQELVENGCQEIGRWLRHDLFLGEPSSRPLPPLPPVLRGAQEDSGVHPGHGHPLGAEAETAVGYQWRILLLQATDAWSSQAKEVSHRLDVAQVWPLTTKLFSVSFL